MPFLRNFVTKLIEIGSLPASLTCTMTKKTSRTKSAPDHLLIEVAWEVCNQVGGIYTVIRSKAPAMTRNHSGHYCMVGPYLNKNIMAELEPLEDTADVFGLGRSQSAQAGLRSYVCRLADYRKAPRGFT
jgi:hypothetical protein